MTDAPADPNAELPDDLTIADECRLFRRIVERFVIADGATFRISSQAFNNSSDGSGMSVWLEDRMLELELTPEDALVGHQNTWLAEVTAGAMRALDQRVVRTPQTDEPAHGEVLGSKSGKRRGKIRDQASWAIPPGAS